MTEMTVTFPLPSSLPYTGTNCSVNPGHFKSLGVSWWMSALSNPVCFACLAGVATYVCVAHLGYWDPQGPDLSNCTSPWVNHIMQKVSPNAAAGSSELPSSFCLRMCVMDRVLQPFLTHWRCTDRRERFRPCIHLRLFALILTFDIHRALCSCRGMEMSDKVI